MTFSGETPHHHHHHPPITQPMGTGAEIHAASASPGAFWGAPRFPSPLSGGSAPSLPHRSGGEAAPRVGGEPRGGTGGCATAAAAARGGGRRGCAPPTHPPHRSPGDLASTSTGPRSAGAAARPVAAGPGGHRGGSRVSSLSPPPPGPGLALLAPLPGPQAPVKTVAKTSLLPPHRRRGPALLKSP